MPISLLAIVAGLCYNYKTQLLNLFAKGDALSQQDERFISKRLAGLLDSTYQHGKLPVGDDIID